MLRNVKSETHVNVIAFVKQKQVIYIAEMKIIKSNFKLGKTVYILFGNLNG